MIERRQHERIKCDINGAIETPSYKFSCKITDITKNGIGGAVRPGHVLQVGRRVTIHIGDLAAKPAIVRWLGSSDYGLEFQSAFSSRELSTLIAAQTA